MNSVEISLDCVPLAPGLYGFTLYSTVQGELADWIQNAGMLAVEEGDLFGNGRVIPRGQGHFLAAHRFAVYDDSTTPNVQLDNLLPPAA
jgi:lipopolysaccharide transport system ATP-binding protein